MFYIQDWLLHVYGISDSTSLILYTIGTPVTYCHLYHDTVRYDTVQYVQYVQIVRYVQYKQYVQYVKCVQYVQSVQYVLYSMYRMYRSHVMYRMYSMYGCTLYLVLSTRYTKYIQILIIIVGFRPKRSLVKIGMCFPQKICGKPVQP